MIDYRKFRLSKINTEEFRHVKYWIFWPIYGIVFFILEQIWTERDFNYVYVPFDDVIPFCEYFLIPYMFWFVFLIGMMIYTFFFEVESFSKMMQFIIITYSVTTFIYIVFPNAQGLRPTAFERDNAFVDFMKRFYEFDTNTNVCPSLHVIGSFASLFAGWYSKLFGKFFWRSAFLIATVLISISTVFLKQHSVIDVICALVLCAVAYIIVYRREAFRRVKQN